MKVQCDCLATAKESKYHSRLCQRYQTYMARRIKAAMKSKDVSLAHVLFHSLIGVYNHTPYPVRYQAILYYGKAFPLLGTCCLKGCSQTGKEKTA